MMPLKHHMIEMRMMLETNFLGLTYFQMNLMLDWNEIAQHQVFGTGYQNLMYQQGRGFRTYHPRQSHNRQPWFPPRMVVPSN